MNDNEVFVILDKIKAFQGSMGLHRVEIINYLISMSIPIDEADACMQMLLDRNFIAQSRMTKLYSLTPAGVIKMRDIKTQRLLEERQHLYSETNRTTITPTNADSRLKGRKTAKVIRTSIRAILLGLIVSYLWEYQVKPHLHKESKVITKDSVTTKVKSK